MKKIFFLLVCLSLLATGCATHKTTASHVDGIPVYYTGTDEPAAMGYMDSEQ
ncbi:MAG: hypothetical protein LBI89_03925 [Prevotellaceae bacterium]|jgi:hypothetical protein|nr:hypothetical protein [Prevotellaceae bacterium]